MKRSSKLLTAAAFAAIAAAATVVLVHRANRGEQQWAMLDSFCSDCHNDIDRSGGLTFEGLTPDGVPQHAEAFEAVIRKLRGRLMPPPDQPQPAQAEIDALVSWLERTIDAGAAENPGYVQAHRLSRTEFAHAVEGLLGVEIDPAEYLPTEIEVDGFTNIATALTVSPAFVEQYVGVASTVAHLAVGEPVPKVATAFFPPPADRQTAYVPGMALETEHTLVVLVDRNEQFRETIGGPEDLALLDRGGAPARAEIMARFAGIPLEIEAGVHEVIVTFIERARSVSEDQISTYAPARSFSFTGANRVPGIVGGVDMIGPYQSAGVSRTRSREMLFICEPEVAERESECAERITANLARRAFRRPATQADMDRLMPFYEEGRSGPGGFDEGIEQVVAAVLASPDFLYRTITPADDDATGSFPLDDFELASRLSFFLWSQGPDDELLRLAEAGELSQADVLNAQVERMLADPRAEVLVTSFALPWLNLDDLDAVQPDVQLFEFEFTEALREDFAQEIDLFVKSILLGDADVRDLLTADYTYLNERLARHYGITSVRGPQFRRVALEDESRHGLLGKGAVLLRTSYGDRTSPVLRGAWVLEKLMGTPPAPPPPNVETDLTTPEGEQPKTIRARLEQHRTSPTCAACHGVIDPYGLALENFTVTGRWRDYDDAADAPIDASTELPGGKKISGPVELRRTLLSRPDQFVQAMTQKLMMYALGRELEYFDMPAVRSVVHEASDQNYRFAAIVAGIVRSEAFRTQGTLELDTDESKSVHAVSTGVAGRQIDRE
jgi:hypothetical protein